MFNLSAVQLRFTCEALTSIQLNGYNAGSNLRGALNNVMRRAYCGHGTPKTATGEGSGCPVCWLLAANEHPGEERRGYALVPPGEISQVSLDRGREPSNDETLRGPYAPGQRFAFGLTLFGDAQRFLPYFILAVPEMGRLGVGAGRGQFALRSVTALDPLDGADQVVLAEGASLVRVPDHLITPDRVQQAADRIVPPDRLRLNFHTPLRLIDDQRLVKAPDFGVLFKRLLERLDELSVQYSGGTVRPVAEVQALQTLANQVRLIDAHTQWIELQSGSSRSGKTTWLSGFIGRADYAAPFGVWRALLPWLMWGTVTQVGKDVVKGNGVYRLDA